MNKAEKKAIVNPDNPNGIYLYEYPVINGIKQYIQVRGTDRKNPLMLFIHGGPGGSMAGFTHFVHKGWEEKFTLVNWDQRNSCKTYFANKDKAREVAKTGTMADYLKDIDEIIAYLHGVYDFEKIIIVGFSWGSAIGSEYAKLHPENLLCYISIGQLTNYRENVLFTCKKLLEIIPKGSKDTKKVKHIINSFPENVSWDKTLMKCMRNYLPLCSKYIVRHAKRVPFKQIFASPFMNFKETVNSSLPKYNLLTKSYETMLAYDFRNNTNYKVPVLFVFGDEEIVCNPELVAECFEEISAPQKRIEIIPKASHSCFFDQPESYNEIIDSFLTEIKAV